LVWNFKLYCLATILGIITFIVSCGVKSSPVAPEETNIPSYLGQFTQSQPLNNDKGESIEEILETEGEATVRGNENN